MPERRLTTARPTGPPRAASTQPASRPDTRPDTRRQRGRLGRGRGIGRALLEGLIQRTEAAGIRTLQAGMSPREHGQHGLAHRLLAERQALGQLDGRWRDVNQYERRSRAVGVRSRFAPIVHSPHRSPDVKRRVIKLQGNRI